MGFGIIRWFFPKRMLFCSRELRLQCFGHGGCHFALNAEDVFEFAIITLSPKMFVGGRANQLHVDVHLVASLLDTAFEDVRDAKLMGDL